MWRYQLTYRRTWYCSKPNSPLPVWKGFLDRPAGAGHPDELAQRGVAPAAATVCLS